MKPTRDNIIVTRIQAERKTDSGLILQSGNGEPDRAKVLAIGPKVDEVKVDEVVLVNWNKAVKIQDEDYVVPISEVVFVFD